MNVSGVGSVLGINCLDKRKYSPEGLFVHKDCLFVYKSPTVSQKWQASHSSKGSIFYKKKKNKQTIFLHTLVNVFPIIMRMDFLSENDKIVPLREAVWQEAREHTTTESITTEECINKH